MLEFILGFIAGWLALKFWVTYRAKKIIAQIESKVEENIKANQDNKVELEFQKQGNKIYAYQAKDGVFVSHGITMKDIIDDLEKRFPNTHFVGNQKNIKEVTNEPI
jgi:hypothetical protein